MKLIPKTSGIVLEIVIFYNTLSFPKAYVIKFFLFLCSESSNIANNKGKFGAPDKPCGEDARMLTQKTVAKRYMIEKNQ